MSVEHIDNRVGSHDRHLIAWTVDPPIPRTPFEWSFSAQGGFETGHRYYSSALRAMKD
jgi:hypothetical protein